MSPLQAVAVERRLARIRRYVTHMMAEQRVVPKRSALIATEVRKAGQRLLNRVLAKLDQELAITRKELA